MQSQPLDERRLVSVSAFKSLVVPDTKRYGDDDDAYSICAVVSRSSAFREVKSNKRAKPYYYVDFDIVDDSCNEVLGVKLWGDVARFEQLRHQLVKGALVLLQSVSLRKDCYRNNKLTIQEHRYGYSSCIYIVERNPQSGASASSSGCSHTYYLDRGNTSFPTVQLFDGRFVALATRIKQLESWSKASSTFHSSANLVKSSFASSFVDALEVAPSTDGVIDLCVTLDVAVVEVQCVDAIKEDNEGKRVVLYDGFARSKAGASAGATIEVMDLGGRKAAGLVDGDARTKLEMMLCEVLGAESARPGISSVVEGGAVVTAEATSSSGNHDDNSRNRVRETLTVLIQAARVRRSSEGAVVVLHMDAQASFFGFNDAHGSHTHHMMALENAQSLSFGDFLKAVMSPSSTKSSRLFRVRCLLREVAFADWAVQSLPAAGVDTWGHGFDNSAQAVAAGVGAGGPQSKVILSRMLEATRYGTHMEVRYRDAIFSLGAIQPPPQARVQAQSELSRVEQKGKRDANAMMPEPLSPQPAKGAGHNSASKNVNERPPPVSKSPPPSDPSFVYSVPLSAATMPPSAASAHSQTTTATTTTTGHGRGGYYHHPPSNMNTNPNPSLCSQLHSYYSQAQPPVTLQQSQEENAWVAVLVKDAVLTEIFSNIPCGLAAACLAKEEHENKASTSSSSSRSSNSSNLDQLSHNYAQSVRQLASSLVHSAALGDGLEVECVLEVLPRNDENDAMLGKQHLCIMQSFNVVVDA
jgi:hypothetical protein